MTYRRLTTIAFLLTSTPNLAAEELPSLYDTSGRFAGSYLCIAEAAGGIAYEKNSQKWHGTSFSNADRKTILSVTKGSLVDVPVFNHTNKAIEYRVRLNRLGEAENMECEPPGGAALSIERRSIYMWSAGIFECAVGGLYLHKIHLGTLRHMEIYLAGFVDGLDNQDNTPAITIGRCSKL